MTGRPLSAQAGRALVEGDEHPDGIVRAPLAVTRALLRRGLVSAPSSAPSLAIKFGDPIPSIITDAGRVEARARREVSA